MSEIGKCIFCERPVTNENRNGIKQCQVVFDGVPGTPDGNYKIRRKPGKWICYHETCEMPPEIEAEVYGGSRESEVEKTPEAEFSHMKPF